MEGGTLRREAWSSNLGHHIALLTSPSSIIMLPGMAPESTKVESRRHSEMQSFHICAALKSAALRKLEVLMDTQAGGKLLLQNKPSELSDDTAAD